MKLTMQERLNCPRSYGTDENKNLMCSVGNEACDGELYECCFWDNPEIEERALKELEGMNV